MVKQVSREIDSNQAGVHKRLEQTVRKHLNTAFQRPIADHSQQVFDRFYDHINRLGRPLMIDACCGVGDSTRHFARQFPDHFVVGLDKSGHRLTRERAEQVPDNMMLLRTDLNDFYRLASAANITPDRHYILYPNPWPKAAHLKRRWHGAPVFPSIIALGGRLELRSNWDVYLLEFQAALNVVGKKARLQILDDQPPITPFEAKYKRSGQTLWQLTCCL